jgi:ferric-dicitrate binding protein FerR (iron transport regulator)
MQEQHDFEKIERVIEGLSDEDEKVYVESLFLNGEDNSTLRQLLEKDWIRSLNKSSSLEVDLNHLLDKVHHKIDKEENAKRQKPIYRFIRIYKRAAAILLIPLVISGSLVYNYLGKQNRVLPEQQVNYKMHAPLGSRVSFNLPDGTRGMLNNGSSLSYSIPFNHERRIVLDGEGYFEVSHDEKHPFEITVGSSTIKVLGTILNISGYSDEKYVEVVLEEGKVEYFNPALREGITMAPSERLVFQNGKVSRSISPPGKFSAWTEGKLVFRGDPMTEVARRIERWYNIDIVLSDKILENYSFRGTFEDDRLENVLQFLSMTSPIRYQVTEPKILSDGTIEKEKVTIFHKN